MPGPSSPSFRVAALVPAVLLVFAQLLDGSGAHRCPEHDAFVPPAAESHGHATGHHGSAPAEGDHHGGCNCLGASCGSVAAFEAVPAMRPFGSTAQSWIPVSAVGREAPDRPPHLLPFALGPPQNA
jgi:hypothetical protein